MNQAITKWVFDHDGTTLPVTTLNFRELRFELAEMDGTGARAVSIREVTAPFMGRDRGTTGLNIRAFEHD